MLGLAVDLMAHVDGFVEAGIFDEVVLFADVGRVADYGAVPALPPWSPTPSRRRTTRSLYGFAAGMDEAWSRPAVGAGTAHSFFTSALLEGLYGAAANGKGVIDSDSLSAYVITRQRELGLQVRTQGTEPEFRISGPPIVFRTGVELLSNSRQQASTTQTVDEVPIDAEVARRVGITKTVDSDLKLLLVAAVSLLDQKSSETDVLSSSTVFLAAVEWGGNREIGIDAPPDVRALADAVRTDAAAYEQLLKQMFRSVPVRLSFDARGFHVPTFDVSDNLRRAFREAERTSG